NLQTISFGAPDWGVRVTYNMLTGNEYHAGDGTRVDAGYTSHNVNFAVGADLTENAKIEFKGLRVNQQDVRFPSLYFDIAELNTEAYSARFTLDNQPYFSRLALDFWYNYTVASGDTTPATKQIFLNRFLSTTFSVPLPPVTINGVPTITGFNPGFVLFARSDPSCAERWTGYRLATTWGELKPDKARFTAGTDLNVVGQGLRENIRVLQQLMPGTVGGTPVGPGGLPIAPN